MTVFTCAICGGWHEKHWQMLECQKSHGDMTREECRARDRRWAKEAHDKFEARNGPSQAGSK